MNDGGMGSLKFLYDCEYSYGGVIVEAEYIGSDAVEVLISLLRTKENQLYELDVFKGDFSPLKRFPKASQILNKRIFN